MSPFQARRLEMAFDLQMLACASEPIGIEGGSGFLAAELDHVPNAGRLRGVDEPALRRHHVAPGGGDHEGAVEAVERLVQGRRVGHVALDDLNGGKGAQPVRLGRVTDQCPHSNLLMRELADHDGTRCPRDTCNQKHAELPSSPRNTATCRPTKEARLVGVKSNSLWVTRFGRDSSTPCRRSSKSSSMASTK